MKKQLNSNNNNYCESKTTKFLDNSSYDLHLAFAQDQQLSVENKSKETYNYI